ncbi:hypothetical protein [Chitinophaga flava]|uniref:Uncharacterized protein n=1 Tax=Chitinophaga flava TaxID=2259036 RepID=A0A365XTZ8_9BACT|nr:hypothetical protein [Chitinophaga flava]RBL89491.1 hypothetical protein DF182_23545 [Chitinophaga flava]
MMKEQYNEFASIAVCYNDKIRQADVFHEPIRREMSVVDKVVKMMEWNQLNYDQRREWRVNMLNAAKNMAKKEGMSLEGFKYDELFCMWDERLAMAINMLDQLLKEESDTTERKLLFRLHAMFLAEQYFLNIDRMFEKSYHNDYYVMVDVMIDFSESKYADKIGIEDLKKCFVYMYKHWEKRPYQEV